MNVVAEIQEKFKNKIEVFEKSAKRVYVTVPKPDAKELVRFLLLELGARFSIASGVDTRPGIEILYHMAFDELGLMVSVRTLVEKPELAMETFTDFMPAADWIEREIHEMLGVNFIGHPHLERFLLPDDWPEGVYPQRKKTFESEQENPEREYA
jgi:Ni,Fe-hydrogenase III component G